MKNLYYKIIVAIILLIEAVIVFSLSAGWFVSFPVSRGFIFLILGIIGVILTFFMKTSD